MGHNSGTMKSSLPSAIGYERSQAQRAGWYDALADKPLDPFYADHDQRKLAWSYMFGRQCAVEWQQIGKKPPVWFAGNTMPTQVQHVLGERALADYKNGNLPSVWTPSAMTKFRPQWLVLEDLAAEMEARGLPGFVEKGEQEAARLY